MANLTKARVVLIPNGTIKKIPLPLPAGQKAFTGGVCCWDSANPGGVYPIQGGVSTLTPIGTFIQDVDNSAGGSSVPVGVELSREVQVTYLDNATGGGAVTTAALGVNEYLLDDHTVTTTAGSNSHSGRVWIVNAAGTGQIGVEFPF